jgi:acetyl esterase/lipase
MGAARLSAKPFGGKRVAFDLKEHEMPSWQSHVLRLAQLGFRAFNGRFAGLDIVKERRNAAVAERLFKPSSSVEYSAVTANSVPSEWIVPMGLSTTQVVLYVHGGAFYSGSLVGARPVAASVALAGQARVLTIDYRLTPDHPFPAALEDTRRAYEWLVASGVSSEAIILVGDSAGGTLVLALLVQLRDHGQPLPRGAVCLSPTTDLTLSGETWTRNAQTDLLLDPQKIRAAIGLYLQDTDPRTPLASPLYADLHGLPPLLILVGSDERLLSDATRLAAKAEAAGVTVTLEVWDRMQHGWHILAGFLPEGRQAIARIGEFIQVGSGRPNT